ncbi:MAG: chemotaxis protein CheA [Thermodesulfobacteriota bacterium]
MEDHRSVYREEAFELLADLESSLLELEQMPDDMELIGHVFRCLHTIKGSGAMFGFDDIAAFTHEIETVFDRVRDGKLRVSKNMVDLTLAACDLIKKMVNGDAVDPEEERTIVRSFQEMLPEAAPDRDPETDEDIYADEALEKPRMIYRIGFKPAPDIFTTGTNPLLLIEELRSFGPCEVIAHTGKIPPLDRLEPESCFFQWDIFLSTFESINAIRDVFIFVEDHCTLDIRILDRGDSAQTREMSKRLGEILVEHGAVTPDMIEKVLRGKKRVGEMLLEAKAVDRDTLESALVEQQHLREADRRRKSLVYSSSIRVAAEKLDALVDLAGELVTVQARLTRKAALQQDPELTTISEEVERLSSEMRDSTMNIRMLPVGNTFRKFKRLIHDLSNDLGKEVAVVTEGEETELDKNVLEQLNDPLIHIIRNAIDHDIEPPDVREARGKPRQGTIRLAAEHSGSDVLIHISGDGAGLDTDAILSKAVEKGLIPSDADLAENEIHSLIFTPGFSTAKQVSGVSGRGVGMDVVKRRVESLRGSVEIHSKRNAGTTLTLKLPLTLAIADGLLVKIGEDEYVLPLLSVEECVELTREEADKARERRMMNVRGELISFVSLRDLFKINGGRPEIEKVVIVESNGDRVGFAVDVVIGQHQTVIKGLGKFYKDIRHMSGATILGDGTVALILDVAQIVRSVQNEGIGMH